MTGPRFTREELAAATGGRWLGAPPAAVEGVSTDTRTLAPGALFVALRGERFDAHDYLGEAAAKGAAAALVAEAWASEPGRAGAAPLPLLAAPDTLGALGAVARLHRRRFAIPVVAVTGSNGKTTTREMIAAILATRGPVLKTEGNLNNEVGVPLTLLGLDATHTAAVIEMGMNHRGEIARLAAIAEPHVGVVTLAAPAHLEGLGTVDAVADAKAELYQGLPAGGIAVANADDARMLKRAQVSGRRLVTFSAARGRRGDVVVLEVLPSSLASAPEDRPSLASAPEDRPSLASAPEDRPGEDGLRFVLGIGNRELAVHVPALVGAHNAANAAAAAAACIALGCTDREIARGLAAVRPVGRRLRLERLPSGVLLLDDCYNANPASMTAALATLADLGRTAGGRTVAVLGDMLELGAFEAEAHRAAGAEAAHTGVGALATFGPRMRGAAEAARAAGLEPFWTEDVAALVAWARASVAPGDVLLVKGSRGMKLERLVEALR